MFNGKTTDKKL